MTSPPDSLKTILVKSAESALEELETHDHMPSGHNGPWSDDETPVRNTAHWGITFAEVAKRTGRDEFRTAARTCATYLMSEEARPYGYTFCNRRSSTKDACNGLIGQAWAIEALTKLGEFLGNNTLLERAEDVFELHPFDQRLGGWHTVEINGSQLGYQFTLNQQIWFAAAGAELASLTGNARIERLVLTFLDTLSTITTRFSEGPFYHTVVPTSGVNKYLHYCLENIRQKRIPDPMLQVIRNEYRSDLRVRSIGYHSFILYSLAVLYDHYPDHHFWESNILQDVCKYSRSEAYTTAVAENKFSYTYNPTGFEMAFWEYSIGKDTERIDSWVTEQIKRCYSPESRFLDRTPHDSKTLSARLYEATRLPNMDL